MITTWCRCGIVGLWVERRPWNEAPHLDGQLSYKFYALSRYVNIFPIQLSSQRKIKFAAAVGAKKTCFAGSRVEALDGGKMKLKRTLMDQLDGKLKE